MHSRLPLLQQLEGRTLDRRLRAFWRHFPEEENDPAGLVRRTIGFQRRHAFDLVKVSPPSSYCVTDYGQTSHYAGDWLGRQQYGSPIIRGPEDWLKLRPVSSDQGALKTHIGCVRAIVEALGKEAPVVATIFSPLTQARRMTGDGNLLAQMEGAAPAVEAGLHTLAETVRKHMRALEACGVAGFFYVAQESEFLAGPAVERWAGDLNRGVLDSVNAPLRILHVHGVPDTLDPYLGYPVNILHWHDQPDCPQRSLEAVAVRFDGMVSGGLHWDEHDGLPADGAAVCRSLRERMNGCRYLLSGNCVLPVSVSDDAIDELR